jgi:ureidoacrylate peracid hydrolase
MTTQAVEVPPVGSCAVAVIDMQNDYCHERGAMARMGNDVGAAESAAASISELQRLAHDHDVPCIFVRTTHGPWTDTPGWRGRGRGGGLLQIGDEPFLGEGSWGAEFFGVEPAAEDLVITKHRYSAFAFTPFELALRARACDSVLFAGTMTNVCVEATALDAVMRGFRPLLVADCTATSSSAVQAQSIDKFAAVIGPVVDLARVRAAWTGSQHVRRAG